MSNLSLLQNLFHKHADNNSAIHMEKYMRNQFPFLGIKTPLRKKLTKQFFKESNSRKQTFQPDFALSLWNLEEREYQYAAMDYIAVSLEKLRKEDLFLLQELITAKSWWDTVDMLAQKAVGKIAKDCPAVISETVEEWNRSNNLWLNRSAILFQLKYKEDTNERLLYRYIQTHADRDAFFIQKAIGWALREYSKTDPASVRSFIKNNKLAKLSVREGSKYI